MQFTLGTSEDDENDLWSGVSFLSGQRPDSQQAFAIMMWEAGSQNGGKVGAAFEIWASMMNKRFESPAGEAVISPIIDFVFERISDIHKFELDEDPRD